MTNEEFAAKLHEGDPFVAHELWENVKRFAMKTANRWDRAFNGHAGVTVDDLIGSAYVAMVDAAASYAPDSGSFLTWYAFYLKTAFCECYGLRRRHTDPLNDAQSLDAPLGDDEDGVLSDLIADPNGETPLQDLEEQLYQQQLHDALEFELGKLSDPGGAVLRMRYYDQMTYKEIASSTGETVSRVRTLEEKGLQKIRYSDTSKGLLEFFNFDYYHGTGLRRFKQSGASIQERYLMSLERERQREIRRRMAIEHLPRSPWTIRYFENSEQQ